MEDLRVWEGPWEKMREIARKLGTNAVTDKKGKRKGDL